MEEIDYISIKYNNKQGQKATNEEKYNQSQITRKTVINQSVISISNWIVINSMLNVGGMGKVLGFE